MLYIPVGTLAVCEVNKLERRFYLVDAEVLPEVFLKVVKRQGASGKRGSAQHLGCDPQPWIFRAVLFISIRIVSLIPRTAARSSP